MRASSRQQPSKGLASSSQTSRPNLLLADLPQPYSPALDPMLSINKYVEKKPQAQRSVVQKRVRKTEVQKLKDKLEVTQDKRDPKPKAKTELSISVNPKRTTSKKTTALPVSKMHLPSISRPLYLYCVGPYNNPDICMAALKARPWFAPAPNQSTINFYWLARFNVNYDLFDGGKPTRCINRFERYFEIHEKDNIFRNLWFCCRRKNADVFQYVPLTFSFRLQEPTFYDDLQGFARAFRSIAAKESPKTITPIGTYHDKYGGDHPMYFDFVNLPVPDRRAIPQPKNRFLNVSTDCDALPMAESYNAGKNLWMLKPSWMSRGRGIEIFKSLEELNKLLFTYLDGYEAKDYAFLQYSDKTDRSPVVQLKQQTAADNQSASKKYGPRKQSTFPTFVIQKYLERPMLYKGYKFDIRMYGCLTHEYEVFACREAYVRLSSYPFTLDKLNYYIHLTNNAVQEHCPQFNALIKGNIFPLSELEREAGRQRSSITSGYFMRQMVDIVQLVFEATYDLVNPNGRQKCFELFGFDFMIDDDFKVWLIEVNSGPSLSESNEFLSRLLHRMMGRTLLTRQPTRSYCRQNIPSSTWKFQKIISS